MQYPEERWVVPEGYRGAPYLVKDQDGRTKCVSCQLCEFVCPPKAIRITPPGPEAGAPEAGNVEKTPKEFEINMLRCIFCGFCQEVCPEEAIFLMKDYSLTGTSRAGDDLRQRKTARPGRRPSGQDQEVEDRRRRKRASQGMAAMTNDDEAHPGCDEPADSGFDIVKWLHDRIASACI